MEGDSSKVPSSRTVTLSFAGGPLKTLDVCAAHDDEMVTPLVDLLAERGVPIEGAPVTRAPRLGTGVSGEMQQCPICGQERTGWSGVQQHLINVHKLDAVTASRNVPRPPDAVECPTCGLILQRMGLKPHMASRHKEEGQLALVK